MKCINPFNRVITIQYKDYLFDMITWSQTYMRNVDLNMHHHV